MRYLPLVRCRKFVSRGLLLFSQEERFRSSFGTLSFLQEERLLSSLWKIAESSSSALVRRGRERKDSGVEWRSAGNIKRVAHSPKREEPRTTLILW